MKEIEFRGKRTDTKEWIYGNLLKLTHEEKPIYYIIPNITNGSWSKEKLMLKFISPCFEIIPETVGQFTGLKDKNGKEIFEGDILKYETDEYGIVEFGNTHSENKYESGYQGFYIKWLTELANYWRQDICYWKNQTKVIGNITDNPELLERG